MQKIIAVFFTLFLFFLSPYAQAVNAQTKNIKTKHNVTAKNPVGWSISPTTGFSSSSNVGSSYAVTYTMTNNLPFPVPLSVSGAYNGGKFTMTNECNTTLPPNGTCLVHLLFQPISARDNNATITLAYHKNRVPLPTLSSTSVSKETVDRINGHVSIPLPVPAYVGVAYPVTFTFVNNGDKDVTTAAVKVSGFTPTTDTCLTSIPEHSNCSVSGSYTPGSTGAVTLSVTYEYAGGSVPLSTSTNVEIGGSTCHQISGYAGLPLPTQTLIYSDSVVQFVFQNDCPATTETISSVNVTSDNTASPAPTITVGNVTPPAPLTACSTTLAPTASCAVYASLIPNTTYAASKDLTLKATLTYNSGKVVEIATSEVVSPLTNDQNDHYFMLESQCEQTVWYGFNPSGNPSNPSPSSSWQGYQLDQQVLGAAPGTKILQLPQYNGGNAFGRTGCETDSSHPNYGICQTANCTAPNSATGQCTYQPNPPFTIFEENMYTAASKTPDGVYDISMVNGFNLPGEIRSLSPYVAINTYNNNFNNTCGNSAGAVIQPAGSALGVCTWSFSPPTSGATDCTASTETDNVSNFYVVSLGSSDDGCTPPSGGCSAGQVCGMSQSINSSSVPVGTPIYRHCGTFEGYWSMADWVGFDQTGQWGTCDLYQHYDYATVLGISTYGYSTRAPNTTLTAATLADLYACAPTSSQTCYSSPGTPYACFNSPANPYFALNTGYNNTYNVCGCHDWNNSSTTPAAAYTPQSSQCLADNSLWDSKVYSRILWLKEACPTAYSYQFDDKSSSFQCNVSGHLTSYQLTFCPGGRTGAPGT